MICIDETAGLLFLIMAIWMFYGVVLAIDLPDICEWLSEPK